MPVWFKKTVSTVTIKDVANHAGVSEATVSRVINGHESVTDELRSRVLEAVHELGYQPNRAARRLRASVSDVLGLIISDIQNPYFTAVVRGVEDVAYARRMSVVLCNTDEDPTKQQMYFRVMQAEGVAGLILTPTQMDDTEALRRLKRAGIPVVLLDRSIGGIEMDTVLVDNRQGAYKAVSHLIDLGYRRIGLVGGLPHLTTGRERECGYRDALDAAGIPMNRELIRSADFKLEGGCQAAHELLALPKPPEAIFAANNLMTLGALRAIREADLCIPEDVALVGFDDMPWSSELSPPLTTISQPTYELGQEAAKLLLHRLEEPDAPYRTVTLRTRLVVRWSCGAQHTREGESLDG